MLLLFYCYRYFIINFLRSIGSHPRLKGLGHAHHICKTPEKPAQGGLSIHYDFQFLSDSQVRASDLKVH